MAADNIFAVLGIVWPLLPPVLFFIALGLYAHAQRRLHHAVEEQQRRLAVLHGRLNALEQDQARENEVLRERFDTVNLYVTRRLGDTVAPTPMNDTSDTEAPPPRRRRARLPKPTAPPRPPGRRRIHLEED